MKLLIHLILLFLPMSSSVVNGQVSQNSIHFDGSNYIEIGDNAAFDLQANTSTTFEGWIRFCSDGMVFSKNWCQNQAGYYMNIVNGGFIRVKGINQPTCNSGDLFELTTSQQYAYNTWHHFAFVMEVQTNVTFVKLYMNGVLVLASTESGVVHNSSESLVLGAYKNMAGNYTLPFMGDLDEFRIYNSALTLAQLGQTTPPSGTLILHYPFEPQANPSPTNEPNLGSLGANYSGVNKLTTSPSVTTPISYTPTNGSIPYLDLGPDQTISCGINQVYLNASSSSANYSWFESVAGGVYQQIPGANVSDIAYTLTGGISHVVVVGELGVCLNSDTLMIDVGTNTVDIGNDTTICFGDTLTIDAFVNGGNYSWSNGSTNSSIDVWNSGVYTVDVTLNGCTETDTMVVEVMSPPLVNLGANLELCPDEIVVLATPNNLNNYLWQDGSTSPTFTVSTNGVYWLSSTNSCGVEIDSITVSYAPELGLDLGEDTIICEGSSITLEITLPNAISTWSNGWVGSQLVISESGFYEVVVDVNGCSESDHIEVRVDSPPNLDLGGDKTVCSSDPYVLSINENYSLIQWSNGSTDQNMVIDNTGIYSVLVGNTCGIDSASVQIVMIDCFCELFFPNAFTPNGDEFNSTFYPVFDCTLDDFQLQIYNRWGELILESFDPMYEWDGTFGGRFVPDGMYTYKVIYSSEFERKKELVGHVNILR